MAMESIFADDEIPGRALKPKSLGLAFLGFAAIALVILALHCMWVFAEYRLPSPAENAALAAIDNFRTSASGFSFLDFFRVVSINGKLQMPLYYTLAGLFSGGLSSNALQAAMLFNSVFLLLLGFAAFLAARFARSNEISWTAGFCAMAMPFMLMAARTVSPELALCALVACTWALYIWSSYFEKPFWTYLIGLTVVLGLLTDWRFFICVLPILSMLRSSMTNQLLQKHCRRAWYVILATLLLIVWANISSLFKLFLQFRPSFALTAGESLPLKNRILDPLFLMANAAYLPLFLLFALGFLWLLMARLMPYPKKRDLRNWAAYTLTLAIIFPAAVTGLIPTVLAVLPIALAVSANRVIRVITTAAAAVVLVIFQLGQPAVKNVRFAGRPIAVFGAVPHDMTMLAARRIKAPLDTEMINQPQQKTVLLLPESDSMSQALNILAKQKKTNALFLSDAGAQMLYPDYLLVMSTAPASQDMTFENLAYTPKQTVKISAMRYSTLFGRKDQSQLFILPGMTLPDIDAGPLHASQVAIASATLSGDMAALSMMSGKAQSVSVGELQFYNVRFTVSDITLIKTGAGTYRLAGCGAIRIISGETDEGALTTVLKKQIANISLTPAGNTIAYAFTLRKKHISGTLGAKLAQTGDAYQIFFDSMKIEKFGLVKELVPPLVFELSAKQSSDMPLKVILPKAAFKNSMLIMGNDDKPDTY